MGKSRGIKVVIPQEPEKYLGLLLSRDNSAAAALIAALGEVTKGQGGGCPSPPLSISKEYVLGAGSPGPLLGMKSPPFTSLFPLDPPDDCTHGAQHFPHGTRYLLHIPTTLENLSNDQLTNGDVTKPP